MIEQEQRSRTKQAQRFGSSQKTRMQIAGVLPAGQTVGLRAQFTQSRRQAFSVRILPQNVGKQNGNRTPRRDQRLHQLLNPETVPAINKQAADHDQRCRRIGLPIAQSRLTVGILHNERVEILVGQQVFLQHLKRCFFLVHLQNQLRDFSQKTGITAVLQVGVQGFDDRLRDRIGHASFIPFRGKTGLAG